MITSSIFKTTPENSSKEINGNLKQLLLPLKMLKALFPDPVLEGEDFERYKKARGLYIEDPWERVKAIFSKDDFGNIHPELLRAIQLTQTAAILGGGIGAIKECVKHGKEFIRTNDTNVYLSKNEMYRILSNKSMLAMAKGAVKWGPKVGLFLGGLSLAASCCEAYRNKSGVIEYVVGGYVAGGFSRSAFGIKGFVAGGIIGAVLGLVLGTIHVGIEKLTKTDALVLKYSHYAYKKNREDLFQKLKSSSGRDSTDKLMAKVYSEHVDNPLNALDFKDPEIKNPESKEK